MKKTILVMMVIAAMASCKKSEIAPVNQVQLIEGRMVFVQSSDTTFLLLNPTDPVNFNGSGTIFTNAGHQDAKVLFNGREVTVKANEKR